MTSACSLRLFDRWEFTSGFGFAPERYSTTSRAGIVTKAPLRSSDVTLNLALVYKLTRGATGLAFSPSNPRSYALRFSRAWWVPGAISKAA